MTTNFKIMVSTVITVTHLVIDVHFDHNLQIIATKVGLFVIFRLQRVSQNQNCAIQI